ncbi:DNA mismatch repair endonuclease MutL [Facklamia languida]
MGQIKQMSTELANQIAAGEVVERPASVVKELVENAIDAQADTIQIEVVEAGIQKISVTDNGWGMDREDLELAFLPHATSKLFNRHDLFNIHSLGFRGEALASIASVAKVQIESTLNRDGNVSEVGYQMSLQEGQDPVIRTCPPRPGTHIEVTSLFYNTPARLKHLASLRTEMRHILIVVQDLALAHPQIAFQLMADQQVVLKTSGKKALLETIANLYQPALARQLIAISGQSRNFNLSGYLSPPQVTRTSRAWIHWMVNGRSIKSPVLTNVLLKAYGRQLMVGRFPIAFLVVEVDPRLVDVNVHPTKQTVRMSLEEELADLVVEGVQAGLSQVNTVPEAGDSLLEEGQPGPSIETRPPAGASPTWTRYRPQRGASASQPGPGSLFEQEGPHPTTQDGMIREATQPLQQSDPVQEAKPVGIDFRSLRYVGQIHGTYLVAESPEGFYLIDQHAAQERLRYERLMAEDTLVTQQQTLLVPLVFEFDARMVQLLEDHQDRLEALGIDLQAFGPRTYQLNAYPIWLEVDELDHLIPDLIERMDREPNLTINQLREASIVMQSCRGAIKANQALSREEATTLIEAMQTLEDPYHCPHGRPVFVAFNQETIEKLFKRIMDSHQGGNYYE